VKVETIKIEVFICYFDAKIIIQGTREMEQQTVELREKLL
jgi:hypothetical protein